MDKLVPEPAGNAVSVGKSKLSDSSINLQEENKTFCIGGSHNGIRE